jgi:SAM-dependent methyltransferase
LRLDDPEVVRAEYGSERGLETRMAAQRFGTGPNARDIVVAAAAEAAPRRVLDVGCGTGDLTERLRRELGADVVAVDQSERMVELTRGRGIDARVADVQELPFPDGSFDAVVAAWVLFHVPEVPRALDELARVLRPGGRLVAATNSNEHLQELYDLLELGRMPFAFSSENGEELLRARFSRVERRDAFGWIEFPSRSEAQQYVDDGIVFSGRQLPPFDGPLRVRREPTVFVADT